MCIERICFSLHQTNFKVSAYVISKALSSSVILPMPNKLNQYVGGLYALFLSITMCFLSRQA